MISFSEQLQMTVQGKSCLISLKHKVVPLSLHLFVVSLLTSLVGVTKMQAEDSSGGNMNALRALRCTLCVPTYDAFRHNVEAVLDAHNHCSSAHKTD